MRIHRTKPNDANTSFAMNYRWRCSREHSRRCVGASKTSQVAVYYYTTSLLSAVFVLPWLHCNRYTLCHERKESRSEVSWERRGRLLFCAAKVIWQSGNARQGWHSCSGYCAAKCHCAPASARSELFFAHCPARVFAAARKCAIRRGEHKQTLARRSVVARYSYRFCQKATAYLDCFESVHVSRALAECARASVDEFESVAKI